MTYYYFAASLPSLSLDHSPDMDAALYIEESRSHLSESDQLALDALAANTPSAHPVVQLWRQYETQLRNAVARNRAQRLQVDPSDMLHDHLGYRVTIEAGVERAFQAADPMQREKMLDALRWELLNDIQGTDEFGTPSVITYYLRLQLCKRWGTMNKEEGNARMEMAVSSSNSTTIKE